MVVQDLRGSHDKMNPQVVPVHISLHRLVMRNKVNKLSQQSPIPGLDPDAPQKSPIHLPFPPAASSSIGQDFSCNGLTINGLQRRSRSKNGPQTIRQSRWSISKIGHETMRKGTGPMASPCLHVIFSGLTAFP